MELAIGDQFFVISYKTHQAGVDGVSFIRLAESLTPRYDIHRLTVEGIVPAVSARGTQYPDKKGYVCVDDHGRPWGVQAPHYEVDRLYGRTDNVARCNIEGAVYSAVEVCYHLKEILTTETGLTSPRGWCRSIARELMAKYPDWEVFPSLNGDSEIPGFQVVAKSLLAFA